MKMRASLACVMTAVAAVSINADLRAADLFWDFDGEAGTVAADGSGNWDFTSPNWYNPAAVSPAPTHTPWIDGNNAIFGNPDNAAPIVGTAVTAFVSIFDNVVANDIHINTQASGGFYSFDAPAGNSLTINGNVYKNSAAGQIKFDLLSGPFILGAGDHTFALRDTAGDVPEMAINANISGTGGIIVDNRLTTTGPKEAWGTLATTGINSYQGTTAIKFGRFVISQAEGLGTTGAGTIISEAGTLSVGGPGVALPQSITIAEPITIQRSVYDGGEFGRYRAAVVSNNGSGTTTFTGPFVVDSNDARIAANSSNLVIATNITAGPNATLPMLSVGGDFAGFVRLTGNNTALTGGVNIVGAQLDVENDNQIGGPTAPLQLNGGVYHPVNGYATDFGAHPINAATFNGSINVDDGKIFNINQPLGQTANAVGSLSKRGTGTMNITADVNLRGGQSYWDGGIVNVNTTVQLANIHLRSPIVNVGTGGSLTLAGNGGGNFSVFGQDSTGTNGGPDIAVVNLTGSGSIAQIGTGDPDFNISDNPNTRGTLNISDTATFSTSGRTYLGKQANAIGVINQNGGTVNINRGGDFALVIGRDAGTGFYNFNAGALNVAGEMFVGQGGANGAAAGGTFTQTSPAALTTINNWFVIGREGGRGTVTLTNTTLIKKGGGNVEIDAGGNTASPNPSLMTVDNSLFDIQTGELRIATGTGSVGTLNVRNGSTVNVNNWIGLGRANGIGVLNLEGGTITKAGGGNVSIAWQPLSNGTLNLSGGTFNVTAGETWISEGGVGLVNVTGGVMNVGRLDVGRTSDSDTVSGSGTLTISGGSVTATSTVVGNARTVTGTINLSGGSLSTGSITAGASTGAKAVNFTGGTLSVGAYNMPTALNNSGTGILAPGGVGAAAATTIAAGYIQAPTARMAIELSDAATFDSVAVTGDVSLAGVLSLNLLNGYQPADYSPVTILSSTTGISGIFDAIEGVRYKQNRALAVTYSGTTVDVQSALPGDANLNGTTNFADLVTLAQNYNTTDKTWTTGDFNGDTNVNFADLVTLAQFYNQSASAGLVATLPESFQADWAMAQAAAVPEPASLAMLGLAGAAVLRRRR